jgi:hypothetical protein
VYQVAIVFRPDGKSYNSRLEHRECHSTLGVVCICREIGARWLLSGEQKVPFNGEGESLKLWLDRNCIIDGDYGTAVVTQVRVSP